MSVQSECDVLTDAILEAGRAVQKLADEGFETARKANTDPVTSADLAADRILKDRLLSAFPGTGWLSEETRDSLDRLEQKRIWIVDPVDGTKEFVSGIPEYAVSVALVDAGRPKLGAVYNPATEELFCAAVGQGLTLNGKTVRASREPGEKLVLLASRSEIKRGEWEEFDKVAEVKPCGSIAYKLAMVAAGRADATFSLGPKNEWDIAAGVLLAIEGGGYAADRTGRGFDFNRGSDTLVDGIVATTAESRRAVLDLIGARGSG
jgi:myo-inositol-1(or 4)-monophosphatase